MAGSEIKITLNPLGGTPPVEVSIPDTDSQAGVSCEADAQAVAKYLTDKKLDPNAYTFTDEGGVPLDLNPKYLKIIGKKAPEEPLANRSLFIVHAGAKYVLKGFGNAGDVDPHTGPAVSGGITWLPGFFSFEGGTFRLGLGGELLYAELTSVQQESGPKISSAANLTEGSLLIFARLAPVEELHFTIGVGASYSHVESAENPTDFLGSTDEGFTAGTRVGNEKGDLSVKDLKAAGIGPVGEVSVVYSPDFLSSSTFGRVGVGASYRLSSTSYNVSNLANSSVASDAIDVSSIQHVFGVVAQVEFSTGTSQEVSLGQLKKIQEKMDGIEKRNYDRLTKIEELFKKLSTHYHTDFYDGMHGILAIVAETDQDYRNAAKFLEAATLICKDHPTSDNRAALDSVRQQFGNIQDQLVSVLGERNRMLSLLAQRKKEDRDVIFSRMTKEDNASVEIKDPTQPSHP